MANLNMNFASIMISTRKKTCRTIGLNKVYGLKAYIIHMCKHQLNVCFVRQRTQHGRQNKKAYRDNNYK